MKSQVPVYFNKWLTLMEQAYEILDDTQWRELEDQIIAEIETSRKSKSRDHRESQGKQVQTSGPQCKKCGAFTTYKRVETHGLCMKCEREKG